MDLQKLSNRAAEAARKRWSKYLTKDCSMCGLEEGSMLPGHEVRFSSRNKMCNICWSNKVVTCGCGMKKHRKMPESEMQIYDVAEDKYYLSQGCMDRANGLSRKRLKEWSQDAT